MDVFLVNKTASWLISLAVNACSMLRYWTDLFEAPVCKQLLLNVLGNPDEDPEVKGVTGIPVSGWNRSAWNHKEGALAELGTILKGTQATRAALSYSTDGLMSRDEVLALHWMHLV